MSEQNSTLKILSDLNVLGALTVGKTLSTTSMQIIDHNSWSASFWRRYTGENRAMTIDKIKGILNEAIFILETAATEEFETSLKNALNGFETLIETYKGDYYTQNNIQKSLDNIRERIATIKLQNVDNVDNTEAHKLIALVVQEQLQVEAAQNQPFRIRAQPDSAPQSRDELVTQQAKMFTKLSQVSQEFLTSPLVKASDRTGAQVSNKTTVISTDAGCSTKSATNMPSYHSNSVNKSDLIARNERLQKLTHAPSKRSNNVKRAIRYHR